MTDETSNGNVARQRAPRGEVYRIAELDEIAAGQSPRWRDAFINGFTTSSDPTALAAVFATEAAATVKAATLFASLTAEGRERAVRVLTNAANR